MIGSKLTLLALAVALIGCSSESGPTIYPVVTSVGLSAPPHLCSNLEPTQLVQLTVFREDREKSVVAAADPKLRKEVESQFSLRALLGGASIPGSFKWDAVEPVVRFHPSAPLAAGEYVAEFKAGTTYCVLEPSDARRRFRVGSLPRVRSIWFDIKNGLTTLVHVGFSEPMQMPTIKLTLSQEGTAVAPTKFESTSNAGVEATLPGVPANKPLRIRVEAQARAETGVALDGDESGKVTSSGTAFQIDLTPSTSTWEPQL